MRSSRSLVNRTLIKENIRRFWPFGLVSLLLYLFVTVPMGLWTAAPTAAEYESNVASSLDLGMNIFGFIGIVCAVVAAAVVFRYAHSPSSITVVHAFPVRKETLYVSNLLTGLLLLFVPFLLNAVIWLAMLRINGSLSASIVYGWSQCVLNVCVVVVFTYAVSVLAGMVTGSTVVHILTSIVFNFAWIVLYFYISALVSGNLFGFDESMTLNDWYKWLHPIAYFSEDSIYMDGSTVQMPASWYAAGLVLYTLLAAAIAALAYRLYRTAKAERAGESITRRPVELVFTYIVTTIGMLIGGTILSISDPVHSYDGQAVDPLTYVSPYVVAGSVIGAVLAFLVATMILKKSARVFNLRMLRRFGIFAVCAAVFLVCVLTPVTGVETRVPKASEVRAGSVMVDCYLLPPYKYGYSEDVGKYLPIEGADDLAALTELHRSALDEKAYIYDPETDVVGVYQAERGEPGDGGSNQTVNIAYRLDDGSAMARSYVLSGKWLDGSNAYARLMSSESVKESLTIKNRIGYGNLQMPEIAYGDSYNMHSVAPDTDARKVLTSGAIAELAACMDEDYLAMSANDMMNAGEEIFTLSMNSNRPAGIYYPSASSALAAVGGGAKTKGAENLKSWDGEGGLLEFRTYYTVTEKSGKTIAWLKEKGIYDSLVKSAASLKTSYDEDDYKDYE